MVIIIREWMGVLLLVSVLVSLLRLQPGVELDLLFRGKSMICVIIAFGLRGLQALT